VDLTLRFTPAAAGSVSAALTIASNDPTRPTLSVSLTGNGVTQVLSSVLRTIAYHEFTALTSPLDTYNIPVISRSGNRAAFTVKTTELWVINTDGSGLLKIDTDTTPNTHFFSISDDGGKVLVWSASFLRVVNADGSGGRTLLTSSDGAVQGARLSGDGRTIVFVNGHGPGSLTAASGDSRVAQRGIWAINSDGTGLRGVVGAADVSSLLNIGEGASMVADSPIPSGIDVSANSSRIVFGVQTNSRGRVMLGVNGDGSALHMIRSGLGRLFSTAISADGSTVAYTGASQSGVPEIDAARFDGSGAVAQTIPFSLYNLQVSNDGSVVFSGSAGNGILWRTDGSSLVELFAPLPGSNTQLANENSSGNRASMNGDGTRFLFTTPSLRNAQNGIIDLALAEINPVNLGAAPVIAKPTVDPASIPGDGGNYRAAITAKVTSSTPIAGSSAQAFLEGLPDQVGTLMTDIGGDTWAGSIFFSTTATGPRVFRVKAETEAADGKRHATSIDFGGFSVIPKQ
jgi:hypothetical protein